MISGEDITGKYVVLPGGYKIPVSKLKVNHPLYYFAYSWKDLN